MRDPSDMRIRQGQFAEIMDGSERFGGRDRPFFDRHMDVRIETFADTSK